MSTNGGYVTRIDEASWEERLAHFGPLAAGAHEPNGKACVMEAVAFVAGEPWSDRPECACPIISSFLRTWNDGLPDDERDTLLRPLVLRLIGTRGSATLEKRRSLMASDWLVRIHTPAWLRLAKLDDAAAALEALPEITAIAQIPSILGPIEAAQRDAVVAWAAAWAAAWDALSCTRKELQQSALVLVNRMIDAREP